MKFIPCTLKCSPPDFVAESTAIEAVNVAIEKGGLADAELSPLSADQIVDEMTARDTIRLSVERQRLCYWLLRVVKHYKLDDEVGAGIAAALAASNHAVDSRISRQMLDMGEPGRHLTAEVPCGSCGGTGKRYGKCLTGARHTCDSCDGSGKEQR